MPLLTLQVLAGRNRGTIYRELQTPVTIGRAERCLVQLDDERVSRYHARIEVDSGPLVLVDLESTNGTRVNGNEVLTWSLEPGDRIELGFTQLLFGSESQINQHLVDGESGHPILFGQEPLPTLPSGMSPSQAARTEELLEFLHQLVRSATETVEIDTENELVSLSAAQWDSILQSAEVVALCSRAFGAPNANEP